MSDNLKLPICPKCNDTRGVSVDSTTLPLTIKSQYVCLGCCVKWRIDLHDHGTGFDHFDRSDYNRWALRKRCKHEFVQGISFGKEVEKCSKCHTHKKNLI